MKFILALVFGFLLLSEAAAQYQLAIGGSLKMPPRWMQNEIALRMEQGIVPSHRLVSREQLKMCQRRGERVILGCTRTVKVGRLEARTIYIWNGLRSVDRQQVLVHEMAHYLFNWKH